MTRTRDTSRSTLEGAARLITVLALASACGCLTEDGDSTFDEAEELEQESVAADAGLAVSCFVGVAPPFNRGTTVEAHPVVGPCSVPTAVTVVIRIDRTLWPDKTIAQTFGSLYAGEPARFFSLGTGCNAQNSRTVFTEVRLSNQLGSAKVQSTRSTVRCD